MSYTCYMYVYLHMYITVNRTYSEGKRKRKEMDNKSDRDNAKTLINCIYAIFAMNSKTIVIIMQW